MATYRVIIKDDGGEIEMSDCEIGERIGIVEDVWGDIEVDRNIMKEALEKLKEAYGG